MMPEKQRRSRGREINPYMNGFKNQPLMLWLLGAMLAVTLALLGTIISMGTTRLDRIEARVESMQQGYYEIKQIRTAGLNRDRQLEQHRILVKAQQGQLTDMQHQLNEAVLLLAHKDISIKDSVRQ